MSFLQRLLTHLGVFQEPSSRHYQHAVSFRSLITELAQQEQRPEEEIHADLLAAALVRRDHSQELWDRWQSLSPREQDVTAFTCLGYTNNQIAVRLGVSVETVKTHMRNTLVKFRLHSKIELRSALSEWDFREWDGYPNI